MSRLVFKSASAIVLATATVAAGQQSAVRTPSTTSARAAVRPPAPRALVGVRPSVTIIQGNALNSTNGQMANTMVRLRDARFGQIVDTELTDRSGLFAFRSIDPGSYIVELIGNDSSVLAASDILNVEAGEVASAVVKLPFNISTLGALLGTNSTTTAAAVVTEAAATGVVAVVATDPVSPIE